MADMISREYIKQNKSEVTTQHAKIVRETHENVV